MGVNMNAGEMYLFQKALQQKYKPTFKQRGGAKYISLNRRYNGNKRRTQRGGFSLGGYYFPTVGQRGRPRIRRRTKQGSGDLNRRKSRRVQRGGNILKDLISLPVGILSSLGIL